MERIIRFSPAWDKRNSDPKKNYGVHGVELVFYLKGEKGTVQFLLYTNWYLPHVTKEQKHSHWEFDDGHFCPFKPFPADLGYHSPKPLYKGQEAISHNCELTGGDCFYDGSTLNAERIFKALTEKGDAGVWEELEKYYQQTFVEGEQDANNTNAV